MRQLFLILLAISVGLTAGRASCADALFPRPSRDALAKAEEKVRELYKADLAKAVKPKDKIALVEVLLTAANGVGQDDASRLVLWTMASDLAVDANDGQLSMKVVTGIVNRFQPDGPTDPKEQMEAGNAPWKEAETAPADKRLRLRIKAAEWYLRARPVVTGLDEILIKKRLDEVLSAKPPAEPEANVSPPGVPTGWVKIVNRKSGLILWWDRPKQIEAAGDYFKIRDEKGGYLALAPQSGRRNNSDPMLQLLRVVQGGNDKSMFWKIEPRGDGSWSITNRQSGESLGVPDPNPGHIVRQSSFRTGDATQEWRFELVKSGE